MALSATFTANFSSFYDAVEKADVKLKDFGAGAEKVGGRLNRIGDQFSGVKIVQEATIMAKAVEEIGGVSKLTEKELAKLGATANEAVAKMRKLGMDVPKNLQEIADKTKGANKATTDWLGGLTKVAGAFGIAFSVDAIKDFIGSVFEAAGAVKDLSDQWGVSTKFVQQWSAAAKQAGVETEQLGKSIQFVTLKLSETSPEYDALIKNIGLSGEALRKMSTEDAYKQIIDKIAGIKDQTLQLDVAYGILGPSAKKVIGGIRDGMVEAADAQKYMSDETIRRLEAAGAAWENFKNRVVIYSGEMLAAVMKDGNVAAASKWFSFWLKLQAASVGGLAYIPGLLAKVGIGLEQTTTAVEKTTAAAVTGNVKTTAAVTEGAKKRSAALTEEQAAAKKLEEGYQAWKRGMIGVSDETKILNDNLKRLAHEGYAAVVAGTLKVTDALPALTKQTAIQSAALVKTGEAAGDTTMKLRGLANVAASMALIKPIDPAILFGGAKSGAALSRGVRERADQLEHLEKLRKGFAQVSNVIALVGSVSRGTFGAIMRYAGQAADMVFQYIVATKAAKLANDVLAASAAAASLAMGAATMGISFIVGEIARDMQAIDGLETRAERAIETFKALRDEFGLTMAAGRSARSAEGKTVTGTAVLDPAARMLALLREAQTAISGLSDVTERFGGVVPKAIRPMLESLLAMKGLPANLRDQMQGFADAPAWQVLEDRARDLGIEMSALGGGFNQKRLADMGFGFFHDLEMFMEQGADLDGVLRGMSDELSTLAAEAVKTGSALPKSLEPYIKKLQEMGLLVDENGNAINDISFADMEDESLKAVVAVLEQIRELLAQALPQAVATFGNAIDTTIGRPRGLVTGGGAWGTVEPSGGFVTGAPAEAGNMTVIVEADGRQLSRIIAPYVPGEVRRLGLARG